MKELTRENARRIVDNTIGLDECVEMLLEYRNRGESVVIDFLGHDLYSCDVTMEKAYIEVTGKTKGEYEKTLATEKEVYEKLKKEREKEAKNALTEWIKKGEQLIYPERLEEWKEYVEAKMHNGIPNFDLRCALEIMEELENGATLEDAKKVLDHQEHSGFTAMFVKNVVFTFSKKGPEFFEYTANGRISSKTRNQIEAKKKENQQLAELHRKEKGSARKKEETEILQKLEEKRQLTREVQELDRTQEVWDSEEEKLKHSISIMEADLESNEKE